jgi:hypothetical protein
MPRPNLLPGETLVKIVGTENYSLSVTSHRVIQVTRTWSQEVTTILQLDEVDSAGTSRMHNPLWLLCGVLLAVVGLSGAGAVRGGGRLIWFAGTAVLIGITILMYGFSRWYEFRVRSKTDSIFVRTDASGLPALQDFLRTMQEETQKSKGRVAAPSPAALIPRLEELKQALEKGLISAKEYEGKRQQILSDL